MRKTSLFQILAEEGDTEVKMCVCDAARHTPLQLRVEGMGPSGSPLV